MNFYVDGTARGVVTIAEDTTEPILVDVRLSYYLENKATIQFDLQNNEDEILRIEDGIVEINANEKTAQFKIYSNNKNILTEEKSFTISIESDNNMLKIGEEFVIKVKPIEQVVEL